MRNLIEKVFEHSKYRAGMATASTSSIHVRSKFAHTYVPADNQHINLCTPRPHALHPSTQRLEPFPNCQTPIMPMPYAHATR